MVDFLQSSLTETPEVHYTMFRERAYPDGTDFVAQLTFDITENLAKKCYFV